MANSYLTIGMISYAMLPVLHNNTIAAKKVTRKYEPQFAKKGAKIGAQFSIRKPPRYVVVKGALFEGQDYTDEQVTMTVDQHDQVGVEFNNDDMTLSMDDFTGRVLNPSLVPLANDVDQFIMSKFAQVWNATGTPGTPAATDTPFLDAKTLLINNAADQRESEWPMLVSPRVDARLSSGLAGRFNKQSSIAALYEKGSMGTALGWNFYSSQNMPTHTTGNWSASTPATGVTVAGANQTGASINISGLTATTTTGKTGDVVQFDGCFAINPITKQNIGELALFVLTADFTADGGGLATLSIDPPLVPLAAGNPVANKNATCTASPANLATVFVWGTQTVANIANKTSPQMMGWSSDGITLACVDFELFGEGEGVRCERVSDDDLGLSLMFTRGSDIRAFSRISRVDILFGTVYTRKEHITRVAA